MLQSNGRTNIALSIPTQGRRRGLGPSPRGGQERPGHRAAARRERHARRDPQLLRQLALHAGLDLSATSRRQPGIVERDSLRHRHVPDLTAVLEVKFGDAVDYLLARASQNRRQAELRGMCARASVQHPAGSRISDIVPAGLFGDADARMRGLTFQDTFGEAAKSVEKMMEHFSQFNVSD